MTHLSKTLLITLLVGGLAVVGCGEDDDPDNQDENQVQNQDNDNQDNGDELVDLVATAEAEGNFTVLLEALEAAELTETLEGDEDYTLFAPDDDAFGEVPDADLDELLEPENQDDLVELLSYHLIEGEITSDNVAAGEFETVAGIDVEITIDGDDISYGGAPITDVDLQASNGVIHTLGEVAFPPEEDDNGNGETEQTLLELLGDSDDFTMLAELVGDADLEGTLDGDEDLTVFAPTDDAFDDLPDGALDGLDGDDVADILLYHVTEGAVMSSDVEDGVIETVDGRVLLATDADSALQINDSMVIDPDIEASNGVAHAVDSVIMPPGDIAEVAEENGLDELVDAVTAAGLVDVVTGDDLLTVFAPTDDAFDAASGVIADLNEDELEEALLYHVLDSGAYSSFEITPGTFETAAGLDVEVSADGEDLMYDTANIEITDVVAENGIVHVIDQVVLYDGE